MSYENNVVIFTEIVVSIDTDLHLFNFY